jgi:hypothetical protein
MKRFKFLESIVLIQILGEYEWNFALNVSHAWS